MPPRYPADLWPTKYTAGRAATEGPPGRPATTEEAYRAFLPRLADGKGFCRWLTPACSGLGVKLGFGLAWFAGLAGLECRLGVALPYSYP